jgi:hypothetical protein
VSKHVEATKTRSSSDLSNINLEFDREIWGCQAMNHGPRSCGIFKQRCGWSKKKKLSNQLAANAIFGPETQYITPYSGSFQVANHDV